MKRNYRSMERAKIGGLLAGVVVALLLLYQGGRWLETNGNQPEARGEYVQPQSSAQSIEIDGIAYQPKKNLTTILLMGIDRPTDQQRVGNRNGGQADFLRLIVIDSSNKTVSQLQIDRDTMTPITVLGVLGDRSGIRTAQISLSHGFGDGGEQSCELAVEAVSNLLLNTPIDFYLAMNLDGISELNDLVGGVTVTLEDDFSALDPTMTKGKTLTLTGDQAEIFVRGRHSVGVGTNESRMVRQEQYMAELTTLMDAKQNEDADFVGTLYDALTPYLTTNMSRGRLINEAWAAKDYEREPVIKPEGVHEVGADGFMQFTVDEASLQEAVLTLFYEAMK